MVHRAKKNDSSYSNCVDAFREVLDNIAADGVAVETNNYQAYSSSSEAIAEQSDTGSKSNYSDQTNQDDVTSIKVGCIGETTSGTKPPIDDFYITAYSDSDDEDSITVDSDDARLEGPKALKGGETSTYTIHAYGKTCKVKVKGTHKETTEESNALDKAHSYAENLYMSKQAIYDQLTFDYGEGFTASAAKYAIDHIEGISWKKNALRKARSYQKKMKMSKAAIYDQLIFEYREQFTADEVQYAIDHLPD